MHSFIINDDGTKIANSIKENSREQVRKIEETVKICESFGQNYDILSWAAKIHWILDEKNRPISEQEIISLAKSHDWNLDQEEIDSAKKLLLALKLVKITDSQD